MHFGIVLGGIWIHFFFHFAIEISLKNALLISMILGGILGSLWLPIWFQKVAPKIDLGRPWGTRGPQMRAQAPQEPQKAAKTRVKLSPGPSKSTIWVCPCAQTGAPKRPK